MKQTEMRSCGRVGTPGAPGPHLTVSEEGTLNRGMSVYYAGIAHPLDGCAFCWFLGAGGTRLMVSRTGTTFRVPVAYWEID